MDCRTVENNLIDFIEEALPKDLKGKVAAHIKECAACSAMESKMRNDLQLWASTVFVPEAVDFVDRVNSHIEVTELAHQPYNPFMMRLRLLAMAASVAFLIASSAIAFYNIAHKNLPQVTQAHADDLYDQNLQYQPMEFYLADEIQMEGGNGYGQ